MPAQQESWIATAYLETGTIARGYVACLNAAGTAYVVASLANRTAAGRNAACIALSSADASDPGGSGFEAQYVGVVPPSITGLGAGVAEYVNVSDAGVLQRTATLDANTVGRCDADGTAYVCFPLLGWNGGGAVSTPAAGSAGNMQFHAATGTGFAADANWNSVDNAGTIRANYWDDADGVTLRANVRVSWGTFNGAETFPSYGFIRLSSGFHTVGGWSFLSINDGVGDRGLITMSGGDFGVGDGAGAIHTVINGNGIGMAGGSAGITLQGPNTLTGRTGVSLLGGRNSGVVNTSGLELDATSIATSGATVALTSAEASALRLILTGTGGTITAPDHTSAIYFVDASAATGAVTFNDGTAGGVTIAAGKCDIIFHDGTNYRSFLTNAAGGISALANVGTGTGLVWRDTTSGTANLKTILAGSFLSVTNNANDITLGVSLVTGPISIATSGSGDATIGNSLNNTIINSTNVKSSVLSTTDMIDTVARVQTTNATATTIATLPLPNNAVTTIDVRVTACQNTTASADAWVGSATYRNAAGTAADVQAASVTHRGATAWSFTITRTTTTIYFTVTGAASTTIEWAIDISYQTTRQA